MPQATPTRRVFIPPSGSRTSTLELDDYSKGVNTYVANDALKKTFLRYAQDARIGTLGEYETRQGLDFHSEAVGLTQDQVQTSTTGAADQSFGTTARLAQKWTAGASGSLAKYEVRLKNDTAATGTIMVEHWTDSAGSPGALVARSSIAASVLTSSYAYLTARFVSTPAVASGTAYWVICYIQTVGSGSYKWSSTTSATTAKSSADSGGTWSSTSFDLNFKQHYATTGASKGLHRAYKSDGTKKTLLAHGTSLSSVDDVTGALTTVKSGLSASATKYRFTTVNDVVYYVNGFDGIRKWDFTTESQVTATNATIVVEHKGLAFYVDKADPNKLFYSNFAEYETFTSTDFIYVPSPKTGDPIVAVQPLNGTLVIFTRHRKYILYGSDNATFQLEEAAGKKGTFTQESVANDRNYIYFLSDDGGYRFNGTTDELLSENIYDDIRALELKTNVALCVNRSRLYLWYTAAGEAANSRCIVFNLNFDAIESFDTDSYVSMAVTAFNDDDKLIVASSVVGRASFQELLTNDYTNLGGDLNFELRTHYMHFGAPHVPKQMRFWKPRFAAQSGNYSITCQYAYDLRETAQDRQAVSVLGSGAIWGSGIIWGAFTWGSTAEVMADLYVPGEYRRIQLRYKHYATRQPQRFLGHTLVTSVRRMR